MVVPFAVAARIVEDVRRREVHSRLRVRQSPANGLFLVRAGPRSAPIRAGGLTSDVAASCVASVACSVVCLSHATGSGGEEVGILVARRLGYVYVDEEIVARAAAQGGLEP